MQPAPPGPRNAGRRRRPGCGTTNAALNRPVSASSTEHAGTPATAAVAGNTRTRWSSAASDPQWSQVDLGTHVRHGFRPWRTPRSTPATPAGKPVPIGGADPGPRRAATATQSPSQPSPSPGLSAS